MRTTSKQIIILTFIILLFGCALPFEWPNPNLEVIIPKEEVMTAWALSPQGDKIVYWVSGSSKPFLLTPATGQKIQLDIFCNYFGWLDDTTLWCINESGQALIMPTDDFVAIPLEKIEAQQTDLVALLKDKIVYKLDYGYGEKKQALLVLDTDYKLHPNENYLIPIKDTDPVWQEDYPVMYYPYKTPVSTGEKVYSPDKAFYYSVVNWGNEYGPTRSVAIYKAITDEKLAEFEVKDPARINVGGWTEDNSGVYASFEPGGMYGDGRNILYKLRVPE
jgi:hypothetical protein